jgi:hypothetical protein
LSQSGEGCEDEQGVDKVTRLAVSILLWQDHNTNPQQTLDDAQSSCVIIQHQ